MTKSQHAGLCFAFACAALASSAGAKPPSRRPGLVFQSQVVDAQSSPDVVSALPKLLAYTDIGNIRLALSNAGTLGNDFRSRNTPSMEWPARSGIDHLVRGALWVGAISAARGDTLVSTGGRDAYYNDFIFDHSEYNPVDGKPQQFSRLRTSPYFRPGTVSDQNFFTAYTDTAHADKLTGERPHTSMHIRVDQNSYGWGFDPLDDFVILEYNIVNIGSAALQDVYVGIYTEFATNNRNIWAVWPPGGVWFDYQDPAWDAVNRMITNHRVNGAAAQAKPWGALKVLGCGGKGPFVRTPDSLSTKNITVTTFTWSPSQFLGWRDPYLYRRMSADSIDTFDLFDPSDTNINGTSIFSVGPFTLLAPGDTVQVVFAALAGTDPADLDKNAYWAQKAYDAKYSLPAPPSSPILNVYPEHEAVTLRWSNQPESELDPASKVRDFQGYRVFLATAALSDSFHLVHQYDVEDGVGFDTGLDAVVRREGGLPTPYITAKGDTLPYELRITGIPDGTKRYVAVSSYDFQTGDPPTLQSGVLQNSVYFTAGPSAAQALGQRVSVFPNPYRGESVFDGRDALGNLNPRKRVLWFVNLPARAKIKIYTLAGDRVRQYDYDAATYKGNEALGISPDRADLSVGRYLVTGGAMAAFDLLSENGQEIANGLYLFSVENKKTGETQQGKFMVLK